MTTIKERSKHIARRLSISTAIAHASMHKEMPRSCPRLQQAKLDSLSNDEKVQLH